ncbi:unnamed protein product, partial [marine sediment metagenome]
MTVLSKIVRTVAVIFIIPALVFGAYIIAHGHLSPGGGFQGGAIIATSIILLLVAFGEKAFKKAFGEKFLSSLESIALLGLIALAFLGMQSTFFKNFLANARGLFGEAVGFGVNPGMLNTAGVIPLMNFLIGL